MEKERQTIGVTDYAILGLSLLVSLAIGIKVRHSSKHQTVQNYLMAGKDMMKLPVILSICVTMLSGVTILGVPPEIYRFGLQASFIPIPYALGMFIASQVFIPVYFECGVSSIYEFLEIRYGLLTRLVVSGLFVVQMLFFMSVVLYAPALSLSAVTDLSLETSIIFVGICCSIYCSIGGLKGVLWTDVFQCGVIVLMIAIVYVRGISEAGGLKEIFQKAGDGGRLLLVNFQFDMTSRYNIWNIFARGVTAGIAHFGTCQLEVQRMLSFNSSDRAKSALMWSIFPTSALMFLCACMGLILYAIFSDCDPLLNKEFTGVTRYDQLLPYYIVSRFSEIPGLTGLCIAGIFSGSLSSISSALNSLSTVTVIDFIKPIFPNEKLSETKTIYIAKGLTLVYGGVCIGFAFVIAHADSIQAVATALMSILEGPLITIFLIGVLTRKGTQKCILVALFFGSALNSWIGYGYIFGGKHDPSLPLNTSRCQDGLTSMSVDLNDTFSTATPYHSTPSNVFIFSRISFMWLSWIGLCSTSVFAFIGIIITGWNHNAIAQDSKCLSPVTKLWTRKVSDEIRINSTEENALEETTIIYTPDVIPDNSFGNIKYLNVPTLPQQ